MSIRPVKMQSQASPHIEGAGVHLHRVFGFGETEPFDPFLMMDDFRNDDPEMYKGVHGIRTGASRPSPMCSKAMLNMVISLVTAASSVMATCSG